MIRAETRNCLAHRFSLRAVSKRFAAGHCAAISSSSGSSITRLKVFMHPSSAFYTDKFRPTRSNRSQNLFTK